MSERRRENTYVIDGIGPFKSTADIKVGDFIVVDFGPTVRLRVVEASPSDDGAVVLTVELAEQ